MKRGPHGTSTLARASVLAALVLACGRTAESPLRVGINPWPGYELAYLAQEVGLLAQEQANVRLVEVGSLGDARRAYERDRLDGFFGTVVEVVLAAEHATHPPRIRLVCDYSSGADVVIAREAVHGPEGLAGLRVGVEPRSLGLYVLARALQTASLPLDAVQRVSLDQLEMSESLARGEVDAVVTYPPVSIELGARPDLHPIFDSAAIPGEVIDVLALSGPVLRDRRADVDAFVRAYALAAEWARARPAEAMAIMARREGITPEAFEAALRQGIVLVSAAEQRHFFRSDGPLVRALDETVRTLRATGDTTRAWRASDLLAGHEGNGP